MKKLFLLLFFIPTLLFAKEIFVINENTLKDLMNENVPSIEKINSLIAMLMVIFMIHIVEIFMIPIKNLILV